MTRAWTWLRARRLALAGWAAVLVFAVLASRFWHPHYGFTAWLQFDETDVPIAVPELKARPVYVYPGQNGYDASSYSQIAFHPLLDSPEIVRAVGNVPYRARRILCSALAWAIALGNPARITHVYAALNLGVWGLLAWLLWRLLPVNDARSWVAWAGLLFSAGALHAVRLALTDLPAVTLFAAAMLAVERGRPSAALGWLATAGLARETAVSGVVALWHGPWTDAPAWRRNAFRSFVVVAPLAAWMTYVRWKIGAAPQGLGNFTWPIAGWLEKWELALGGFQRDPGFFWLNVATLLATLALTTQAIYFLRHRNPDNAWWRAGAVGVGMMALLGRAVWEGHPGAATRVLLPMSLAFAVLAARRKAGWGWIALGNLSVLSGLLALGQVPRDATELAAGRLEDGTYVIRTGAGWYPSEKAGDVDWAWAPNRGELALDVWPAHARELHVRMQLRTLAPRRIEIRQQERIIWSGTVGLDLQRIEFVAPTGAPVWVQTDEPPIPEGAQPGARALGFAVYDPRID